MKAPLNVADYRALADRSLPRMVFDYLEGAADDEWGLQRNREAFRRITFEPQRLRDVSTRDLSIDLFGRHQKLPLVVAPTGLNGIFRPDGDIILARAAADAGIPFILSTASSATIEAVADRAGGDLWFQLYVIHRPLTAALIQRALVAGYKTLLLTCDVAANGNRERDTRNGFSMPFRFTPRAFRDCMSRPSWLTRQLMQGFPQLANLSGEDGTNVNARALLMRRNMDASYAWDDLKALRDSWPHTLVVKGLLRAEDAKTCESLGVDGVVISNHGARQLEDTAAPVDRIEEFFARTRRPILVDSGFRRGADVVKAIALGACAVMIGRPLLYGLAARGRIGVTGVLEILRREIDTTLAEIGCSSVEALTSDFVRRQ